MKMFKLIDEKNIYRTFKIVAISIINITITTLAMHADPSKKERSQPVKLILDDIREPVIETEYGRGYQRPPTLVELSTVLPSEEESMKKEVIVCTSRTENPSCQMFEIFKGSLKSIRPIANSKEVVEKLEHGFDQQSEHFTGMPRLAFVRNVYGMPPLRKDLPDAVLRELRKVEK